MTTKTQTRPTMLVPITEMVEVPVLTEVEREAFIASLREAEASIREGRGTVYKSGDMLKEYKPYRAYRTKGDYHPELALT